MLQPMLDALSADAALLAGGAWIVRSSVLLGVAWLVTRGLRARSGAALRHAVWAAALVGVVALPVLDTVSPWSWNVVSLPDTEPAGAVRTGASGPGGDGQARPAPGAAAVADLPRAGAAGSSARGPESGPSPEPSGEAAVAADLAPGPRLPGPSEIAFLVWALGTAVLLGFLVRGQIVLMRARRRSAAPAVPEWNRRVDRLARRVGLPASVPVRESEDVSVPLTTGVFRPEILLPAGATAGWPRERVDAVILHELAHVRRRDVVTHLLARLACALQWFNPLVWTAARKVAAEGERACDDVVLKSGTRPSAYAEHLLQLVRGRRSGAVPATALSMARSEGLEERVIALLDTERDREPLGRGIAAAVVAGALFVSLLLSVPSAAADPPSPPAEEETRSPPAAEVASAEGERMIVATLEGLLNDPAPQVRAAAAGSLGERRAARSLPRLVAALDDPVPAVRRHAVGALGKIESPAAVEALARVLTEDPSPRVRDAAAWALGETESRLAAEKLARALDEVSGPDLKEAVVEALGETRQPSAVPVLEEMLAAGDRSLRPTVLRSLVKLGTPGALDVVLSAARNPESHLRLQAAEALGAGKDRH